jgi:hypothetical protein
MSIDGKYFRSLHPLGEQYPVSWRPHLAPKAKTDDGKLDFVAVREHDRKVFIKHVDAHLAERKERVPLSPRKFREFKITSPSGAMHLDGEPWPSKKNNGTGRGKVEFTVKRAALLIWQAPRRQSRDEKK